MDDLPAPAVPEAAEHASVESAERSYAHEDGSLVIDILAGPACGTSSTDEIVVCAPDGSEHRLPASIPPPPPEQGFKPEIQIAPNAKARMRAEAGVDGADRVMVDIVIRF